VYLAGLDLVLHHPQFPHQHPDFLIERSLQSIDKKQTGWENISLFVYLHPRCDNY
jgi:hypothetical protein